jgi:hypothetical protein
MDDRHPASVNSIKKTPVEHMARFIGDILARGGVGWCGVE